LSFKVNRENLNINKLYRELAATVGSESG